jgi:hypothetical protein
MEQNMKVNGLIIELVAKAHFTMLMATFIRVNLMEIKLMGKEFTSGMMVGPIMVFGKMIYNMA